MASPVIVATARTPIGKRGGALAGLKAVTLLGEVLAEVIRRAGIEPSEVEQIVGGCVTQAGEQSLNVTRNAWLNTGLDYGVAGTTVDASCGSGAQANNFVSALVAARVIEVGIACGVESMSRVPIGVNLYNGPGHYKTPGYQWDDPPGSQFGGAERIAAREGLTRRDLDSYGLRSQRLAARAWAEGRFDEEVVALEVRDPGSGVTQRVERDEGLRDTALDVLATLPPNHEGALHTAATTSQVSDGAAAVLWMSEARALAAGLVPRARLRHQVVTGSDPYYLLDGPIVATRKLLTRAGMKIGDLDIVEVNEAFASVVLAWTGAHAADLERVNVNGGAIALGHPLGASGARLLVSALHELERRDAEHALVTMCCGGALGTASILQRI
jgi:acetyl-CoA C-acetyltransferase